MSVLLWIAAYIGTGVLITGSLGYSQYWDECTDGDQVAGPILVGLLWPAASFWACASIGSKVAAKAAKKRKRLEREKAAAEKLIQAEID